MLILVVSVIILAVGGYLGWKKWKASNPLSSEEKALSGAEEAADKIIENATKGVIPSLGTSALENKPDVNPADKTNPFTNIKTNPFK